MSLVLATFATASISAPLAQTGETTPVAAISPSAPIAVPDILARADEDQQRVDRAKQLMLAADPADRLGRALDDIARPVDAKLNNTAGGALRTLPVMRLESLARHWEFDARRFARWEDLARRALAPYADSALQLAQRRAAWSATRAAGLLDGLPSAMSSRRRHSRGDRHFRGRAQCHAGAAIRSSAACQRAQGSYPGRQQRRGLRH